MKHFLTCGLILALLLTSALAQKKKINPKVVNKPAAPIVPAEPAKKLEAAPKLILESLRYDFGKIKDTGKPISHTFLVRNAGTTNLEIESVAPG